MPYKQRFFFFNCYFCGEIYYSRKILKRKKCLTCKKTFAFAKSIKFKLILTYPQAIYLLKFLKYKRKEKKDFDFKKIMLNLKQNLNLLLAYKNIYKKNLFDQNG